MITGFEDFTYDLNDFELKILPGFIKGLESKIGKHNAVTSTKIKTAYQAINIKIDGSRIRKLINHIRCKNMVPGLIATSKGYYIATSKDEIDNYIKSLDERLKSIEQVKNKIQEYSNSLK